MAGLVGPTPGPSTVKSTRKRRSLSPCSLGPVEFLSLPDAIHHFIGRYYLDAPTFLAVSQTCSEMLRVYRLDRDHLVLNKREVPFDGTEQDKTALVSLLCRQPRLAEVRVVGGALGGVVEGLRRGQLSTIRHLEITSPCDDDLWRLMRVVLHDGGSLHGLETLRVSSRRGLSLQLFAFLLSSNAFPNLADLRLPASPTDSRQSGLTLLAEALRERAPSCRPFVSLEMEVSVKCPGATSALLSLPCFSRLQELRLVDAPPAEIGEVLLLHHHHHPSSPLRVLVLDEGWELRSCDRQHRRPGWDRLAHALCLGAAPGLRVLRLCTVDISPPSLRALASAVRTGLALGELEDLSLHLALGEEEEGEEGEGSAAKDFLDAAASLPMLRSLSVRQLVWPDVSLLLSSSLVGGGWRALESLELGGCWVSEEGMRALARALLSSQWSRTMRRLDLSVKTRGLAGQEAAWVGGLAVALRDGACPMLESLDLAGVAMGDRGLMALAGAFRAGAGSRLRRLQLMGCEVGREGVLALWRACVAGALPRVRNVMGLQCPGICFHGGGGKRVAAAGSRVAAAASE